MSKRKMSKMTAAMKKKLSLVFLALSVASLAGTVIAMISYFSNNSKVNGVEFIEAASHSIMEAKEMMDHTSFMGWLTIILAIITVLSIAATVVMFVLASKAKKVANTQAVSQGNADVYNSNIEGENVINNSIEEANNESN